VLLIAGLALWRATRQPSAQPGGSEQAAQAPLTESESQRLQKLLGEDAAPRG
jgi:hypothetical protein